MNFSSKTPPKVGNSIFVMDFLMDEKNSKLLLRLYTASGISTFGISEDPHMPLRARGGGSLQLRDRLVARLSARAPAFVDMGDNYPK